MDQRSDYRSGALVDKLARVKIVVSDVDGVQTDDTFTLGIAPNGERVELYQFYTPDGIAALECMRHDIPVYFITGRNSPAVKQRAADLKVNCLQGIKDKVDAIEKVLAERKLQWEDVLFIGNDIQDLSMIRRAGASAAPRDCAVEVMREVDLVSFKEGGKGAFRDIIEHLFKAKNKWHGIVNRDRTLG